MAEATPTPPIDQTPPPTPPAVTPPAAPAASAAPPASPTATPASEAGPTTPPAPAKPAGRERDWRDDRIDKITAQLRDAQRRLAPPVDPNANAMVPREQVDARAVEIAANLRFNEECQKVFDDGSKQFEDFSDKVNELRRVATPGDPQSEAAYNTMIAAAIRSGDAARVLHQLGSDLKQAQRLMGMDPMSMTAEMTRMAMGNGPRNDVSNAPKPITPVSTRVSGLEDIRASDPVAGDRLTSAEWHKRRAAEVAASNPGRSARFR